ncbi:S8 family serine peptidase [Paenibacillus lentus]|nr:S8 family serine peptidase [Paenibacillus lentus]
MSRLTRKIITSVLTLSLLLHAGALGLASASPLLPEVEQEVIVVYKNDDGKETVYSESVDIHHEFDIIPAVAATVTSTDLYSLVSDPNIERVERNIKFRITGGDFKTTSVPSEQSQWNFQAVQPTIMWDTGHTGSGIKVAVIDSGIAPHPELTIAGGISTVDYTSDYTDDNGHGTHVAGIIAAKSNNSGMVGIAPNVDLYAVKSMDQTGEGSLQDVLEGLEWSIQNNMDIINLSLGTDTHSQLLKDMVDRAYAQGIVIVGSAGNSQTTEDNNGNIIHVPLSTYTINYPAKYDSVIAVAAVDAHQARGDFSSVGNEVEIAAPGVDVVSSYLNNGYAISSGTSQAAPHISGMIALLKQQDPGLTNVQLREEIRKYAIDLGQPGRDIEFGYGSATFNRSLDQTAPENITNLHVTGKTDSTISLAWTNPINSDFASNNIYANHVQIGSTAGQSFTLTQLQPNTSYEISIKSTDWSGNEAAGQTITVATLDTPDTTAPAEVSDLAVSATASTYVQLSWTNPLDPDFSKVYLYRDGDKVDATTGTTYKFDGLTPDTSYHFVVKTVDLTGNISSGLGITASTQAADSENPAEPGGNEFPVVDTTPPAEVTQLALERATSSSLQVRWTLPTDPDFAKVKLYINNNFIADTTAASYNFTGLLADKTYQITVKTVDNHGNISSGATLTARTLAAPVVNVPSTPPASGGGSGGSSGPSGGVIQVPVNQTPAPTGNTAQVGEQGEAEQGTSNLAQEAKDSLDQARTSQSVRDFVQAKIAIQGLSDAELRQEFEQQLERLKEELRIQDLPAKKELRSTLPVRISLQVAMKSANYKYIDPASLKPGANIFVLNSKGESLEDAVG